MTDTNPYEDPLTLQRQCILSDTSYSAARLKNLASDMAALDAEIPRWLTRHADALLLLAMNVNTAILDHVASDLPLSQTRKSFQDDSHSRIESEAQYAKLFAECGVLATFNEGRQLDNDEWLYRARLINITFNELDEKLLSLYAEAKPNDTCVGHAREQAVRMWLHDEMENIAGLAGLLSTVLEKYENHDVEAARVLLDDEVSKMPEGVRALVEGIPTLRAMLLEPDADDRTFGSHLISLSNTLFY